MGHLRFRQPVEQNKPQFDHDEIYITIRIRGFKIYLFIYLFGTVSTILRTRVFGAGAAGVRGNFVNVAFALNCWIVLEFDVWE